MAAWAAVREQVLETPGPPREIRSLTTSTNAFPSLPFPTLQQKRSYGTIMLRNRRVEFQPASASPEQPRVTPTVVTLDRDTQAALTANKQSVIGAGIVLTGDIAGAESLKALFIEGTIHGNIHLPASSVNIGPGGQVFGNVEARHIVVSGLVKGNVRASDRAEIRAASSLIGDASGPRIVIEDGAHIVGQILVSAAFRSAEAPALDAKRGEAAMLLRPSLLPA